MKEERKMILEMVKEGTISIEEAERLLQAAEKGAEVGLNSTLSTVPATSAPVSQSGGLRPKRLTVLVTENGKNKVNVKVPFSLVRAGLKFGKSIGAIGLKSGGSKEEEAAVMEMLQSIDIDEILRSLEEGDITLPYTIVDVDDMEDGQMQHVKVVLE
ncbi:hypothetical protein LJC20_07490 [Eubacteriales bacterium OttesenSCG-928-M02]|nr:hypothetical protein [Eubacteriales bacterium OttesenSCG-928-M02]